MVHAMGLMDGRCPVLATAGGKVCMRGRWTRSSCAWRLE